MYRNGISSYFLRACCAVCAIAITQIGTGLRASAQTPSSELSFEVATVKPVVMDRSHPFNPRHFGPHVTPAGASYWSMTVDGLIEYAYDVEPNQVTGPEWAASDHFDIEARFPEGADKKPVGADNKEDRRMLQTLLKDRFNLAFHIEKKELEEYAIVVGKHGAKLTRSAPDPASPQAEATSKETGSKVEDGKPKPQVTTNPDGSVTGQMGKRGTMTIKFDRENWSQRFEYSKMTMKDLAARSSSCLGDGYHKVVDETGIQGNYQVAFDCPLPGPPPPRRTGDDTVPPDPQGDSSLAGSLDALGLKLEKRKVPTDVYVIDHVERPAAN